LANNFTPRDSADMLKLHISKEMSSMLLNKFLSKEKNEAINVKRFPGKDDNIQKLYKNMTLKFSLNEWKNFKEKYGISGSDPGISDGICTFNYDDLYNTGLYLLPFFSYGVLNGGSASSYCDAIKNEKYSQDLFSFYKKTFLKLTGEMKGQPKGITPGYFPSAKKQGASFIELKLRALLLLYKKGREITGKETPDIPFFQMTSTFTDKSIKQHLIDLQNDKKTGKLLNEMNWSVEQIETAIQPLCAALKNDPENMSSGYFRDGSDNLLAIPGGHGQNYRVLKQVYENLYQKGVRYISLGNIDNLGYTVHPVLLAVSMLKNTDAAFEFSFKTPLDKKGGVLVIDEKERINCADIGAGIQQDDIDKAESEGKNILFNCASGIFKLSYLIDNYNFIQKNLPVRFNFQKKEAGNYIQGEQNTWEIIPLIENKIIFAVEKSERFLASKMLLETFLTSGLDQNLPDFPKNTELAGIKLGQMARYLNTGLKKLLDETYQLS